MEIDAYCFSTLATKYAGKTDTATIVSSNPTAASGEKLPVDALNDALQWFDEHEVAPENQIIFASPSFLKALRSTNELYKRLDQSEYKKNVSFLIEEYEGRPVVMVAPNRFKTDILLGDAGYSFGTNAKAINFMVVAKDAVYHVVKYNKVRVFAPEVVQDYDGYKVNARVYHDVFVPDNKRAAVYVSVKYGAAVPGLAVGADFTVSHLVSGVETDGFEIDSTNHTVKADSIRIIPSTVLVGSLYYKFNSGTAAAPNPGTVLDKTGWTAFSVGSTISNSGTLSNIEVVALDVSGRVIGCTKNYDAD